MAVVHCESSWYALDDECTHQGGPLGEGDLVDDGVLRCPWHGARFDVRTGEVLDGSAARPARTYPVTADDGLVTVAVDNAVEAAAAAATDSRPARRTRLAALQAAARTRPEDHEPTIEPGPPAAAGPVSAEPGPGDAFRTARHAHPWWTRCWSSRRSDRHGSTRKEIEARFLPVVLRSIFEHLREFRPEGRLLQGGLSVGLLYAGKPNWYLLPTITPR